MDREANEYEARTLPQETRGRDPKTFKKSMHNLAIQGITMRHSTDEMDIKKTLRDSIKSNEAQVGRWLFLLVVGCRLLVVGGWMLAVCCWLLVVGGWLLVVGRWLFVVGCSGVHVGCMSDRHQTFNPSRHTASHVLNI